MGIVTISRGTLAGGKELAECVAGKLGYECVSREELLREVAQAYGVSENRLMGALDTAPGFFEGVGLGRIHYIAYVRAALAKKAANGDLVYHGQVGHLLLKGFPNTFNVRVVADLDLRVRALMAQRPLSRDKAMEVIKHVDLSRARWVKALYHVDWEDPSLYDSVVDLGGMSLPDACDWVVSAAQNTFQPASEFRRQTEDLLLGAEIRARIARHPAIEDLEVEVKVEDGVATVSGVADSLREEDRIMEVIRETHGVRDIRNLLRVRTSGLCDGG
ncbi:MAG: BON domain-containing protein [Chloroflexi bacterium]|nr:BON domain-containing protein [Chloroflexota bacterium]